MEEELRVDVLDKRVCYQGFFRVEKYRLRHTLFAGGWSGELSRELLERGHAAALLPYDPVLDRVVLLEQFRIGALNEPGGPWLVEIVAGMIEAEEAPADVARREAREEAGCGVGELLPIYEYLVSPGGASERISLYCGLVDASGVDGIHGLPSEGEDIRARAVSFDTAMDWLRQGRVRSATPIIALQWLAVHRDGLRQRYR